MSGPRFWMHESSGALRPVIEAYLRGEALNPIQVAAMRAYLRQWIGSPVWDQNPHGGAEALARLRAAIDGLTDRAAIEQWLVEAEQKGVDPL
jgi:hypothetical protein